MFYYISSLYVCLFHSVFFFKQKTAYEMRISDWSSDVCSSDLAVEVGNDHADQRVAALSLLHARPPLCLQPGKPGAARLELAEQPPRRVVGVRQAVAEGGLRGPHRAPQQAAEGDVPRREAAVGGLVEVVVVGALVGMRVAEVPGLRGRGVVHDARSEEH